MAKGRYECNLEHILELAKELRTGAAMPIYQRAAGTHLRELVDDYRDMAAQLGIEIPRVRLKGKPIRRDPKGRKKARGRDE